MKVSICVGSSCHLKGSYEIIRIFKKLIELNELQDKVELKAAFCLGHCTEGVAVKINDEFVDDVSIDNVNTIFKEKIIDVIK